MCASFVSMCAGELALTAHSDGMWEQDNNQGFWGLLVQWGGPLRSLKKPQRPKGIWPLTQRDSRLALREARGPECDCRQDSLLVGSYCVQIILCGYFPFMSLWGPPCRPPSWSGLVCSHTVTKGCAKPISQDDILQLMLSSQLRWDWSVFCS